MMLARPPFFARHTLCLRITVIILCLWTLITSSLFAGMIWYWWHSLENPSSFGNIPALWTAAWGVFALVSLLGLIGGILEYRPLVVLYDTTLILLFLFKTAVGLYCIIRLWQLQDFIVLECFYAAPISKSDLAGKSPLCTRYYVQGRDALTALFVVLQLIDLGLCYLVKQYATALTRLHTLEMSKRVVAATTPDTEKVTIDEPGAKPTRTETV